MSFSTLQITADVFNSNVYILKETANSACLGAAYCAKRAVMKDGRVPFQEAVQGAPSYELANTPTPGAGEIYEPLIARYAKLEKSIATQI